MALNRYFAVCPQGLEPLLHEECRALKLPRIERQVGGVAFSGGVKEMWQANLWLHTASRVLWHISRFPAADDDALYRGTHDVDWRRFLKPDGTLRVDVTASRSKLTHTQFIAQRVKDAVVDHLTAHGRPRPNVDLDSPSLAIHAHLTNDRCILGIDTSGESLHKRGWRRASVEAPLSETLAASLVLQSAWDRRSPLIDPCCGSGTIVIEAALLAAGMAPGRYREHWAFENLPTHDVTAFAAYRRETQSAGAFPRKLILEASDIDPAAVDATRANLAAAGLSEHVTVTQADVRERRWKRGWNAWIVSNLPYGERLSTPDAVRPLLDSLARTLHADAAGYHLALLGPDTLLDDVFRHHHAAAPAPYPWHHAATWLNGGLKTSCRMYSPR